MPSHRDLVEPIGGQKTRPRISRGESHQRPLSLSNSVRENQSIDQINLELSWIAKVDAWAAANPSNRKRPAHGIYISSRDPIIIFVTVCCDNRRRWLAHDTHHDLLLDIWQDISHWVVGRYVVMPDHLHLFASPRETAVSLEAWIKYWKSQFTKRNKKPSCVWQTDHWDTRMRNRRQYEEKSEYMYANPVRAGLVANPKEWPFQGVVHEIRWD